MVSVFLLYMYAEGHSLKTTTNFSELEKLSPFYSMPVYIDSTEINCRGEG